MEKKLESNGPSNAADCSPSSLTPETDAHLDSLNDDWDVELASITTLARKLERERNELAGYLCRIKLPLPVRVVADLAKLFPGKNIRMKDEGGYLCIFPENKQL